VKILRADFILICDEEFKIIENGAICFDKKILDIGFENDISKKYPDIQIRYMGENSVLMPGLINPHVHLEFSANRTSLEYGNFIPWLNSVIKNREYILQNSNSALIDSTLADMLHSGTTTLGQISSFGEDLESCLKTPQKVVYFNEILGSRPDTVDILFDNFRSRLHRSDDNRSETFIPAISIHSPYSTHPILAKNALDIARKNNYLVSTHFMESQAERDWLDGRGGEFVEFFNSLMPNAKPLSTAQEYLELFHDTSTLFTHCTKASSKELEIIKDIEGFIVHCPASNRLLNSGRLDIESIDKDMLCLGTDGLSSNISLNLWSEMRIALMMHFEKDLHKLATKLIKISTLNGAKALKLNNGTLEKNRDADIISIKLPDKPNFTKQLALDLILHTTNVDRVFINGKETV